MEALGFHQYHHQLQTSPMLMSPISFSCNFRTATTILCLRSIVSKRFSTALPKSCTSESGKIKATNRVSADELNEKWLDSLTCPRLLKEAENPILQNDESCGNGEVSSSNVGSQWVIGIDPDVSGALAVLKTDDSGCSAQVFSLPRS